MRLCKCGCGATVKAPRVFENKTHHIEWMWAGGAREMNALLPREVRQRGGSTTGTKAHESGRLQHAAEKGAARSKEIAAAVRAAREKSS